MLGDKKNDMNKPKMGVRLTVFGKKALRIDKAKGEDIQLTVTVIHYNINFARLRP